MFFFFNSVVLLYNQVKILIRNFLFLFGIFIPNCLLLFLAHPEFMTFFERSGEGQREKDRDS